MTIIPSDTVILANGDFPNHPIPLGLLRDAVRIVCCDGAAAKLQAFGLMPTRIVGDLDSLTEELRQKYADRIAPVSEQSTNDLAKAFRFCVKRNWRDWVCNPRHLWRNWVCPRLPVVRLRAGSLRTQCVLPPLASNLNRP